MNAKKTAPLTTLHAIREVTAMSEKKIRRGRHVGLDFFDPLIEALTSYQGTHLVGITPSLHMHYTPTYSSLEEGWTRVKIFP